MLCWARLAAASPTSPRGNGLPTSRRNPLLRSHVTAEGRSWGACRPANRGNWRDIRQFRQVSILAGARGAQGAGTATAAAPQPPFRRK
eukprot:scaffold398_cov206-Pinguiococcus_pyrenoidosus.AAC.1